MTLDELRAMEAAATPGEWVVVPHFTQCWDSAENRRDGFDVEGPELLGDMECGALTQEDAALIVAARNHFAALLKIAEDAKRALELLNAVGRFMQVNPIAAEYTVNYDETQCDGLCLGEDCRVACDALGAALAELEAIR